LSFNFGLEIASFETLCSDLPHMRSDGGCELFVTEGVLDVLVETLSFWIGVLHDLCIHLLGVLRFPATRGGTDGIALLIELNISDVPLVLSDTLSERDMRLSVSDILIERRSEVVHGILSNIVPLGLGLRGAHDQLVAMHGFGNAQALVVSLNIGIRTE